MVRKYRSTREVGLASAHLPPIQDPLESSSVVERRTVNSDFAGSSPASSANYHG